MKILSIYIRNINSLKGEWTINFQEAPLVDAGLFAITGPTGSGKTTLLDAICLALYNQVPRLGRLSKESIQKIGAVITRDTSDAMAAVTYACGKGVFTSSWAVSRTRTGTLSDYKMTVEDANGKSLVQKKSEVPDKNTELIGLSYEQFIRSMLLAQGEFSQLLKSKKDERTALLEQITGTHIYRRLGQQAYDKVRTLKNILKEIDTRIAENEQHLLSDDAFEDLQNNHAAQQQQKEKLWDRITAWRDQLKVLGEYDKQSQEANTIAADIAAAEAGKTQFWSGEGQRLARFERLLPLEAPREAWKKTTAQVDQVSQSRHREQQALTGAREAYAVGLTSMGRLLSQPVKEDTVWDQWHTFRTEVERLFASQADKRQIYKGLYENLNILLREVQLPEGRKWTHDDKPLLEELEKNWQVELAQAKALLQETADLEPAEMDRMHTIYGQAIAGWQQAASDLTAAEMQLAQLAERANRLEQQLQALPPEESLKKGLQELEERIGGWQAKKELKLLHASMDEARVHLTDGKPCPLCGAVHHPFASERPDVSTHEEDDKLVYLRQELKVKETEWSKWQADVATLTAGREQVRQDREQWQQQVSRSQEIILESKQALPAMLGEETAAAAHTWLKRQEEAWLQYRESSRLLTIARQAMPMFNDMQGCVEEGVKINQQLRELYQGADDKAFKAEADKVEQDLRQAEQQVSDLQKRVNELSMQQEDAAKALQTATADLLKALQPLGYDSPESMEADWLAQTEAAALRDQRQQWENRLAALQSTWQVVQNRLQELAASLPTGTKEEIEIEAADGLHRHKELEIMVKDLFANVRLQQVKRDNLKRLEEERREAEGNNRKWTLLNELIGDDKGKRFAEFAQDLTLRLLTRLANRRLVTLTNRYLMAVAEEGEDENSLYLIDRELGDMRRSVNTASGGESFLLSLALALGLSDLASRQVPLDSIFIDEGFGTLDPEVLDQTLDVLERLQATDHKTIGIISHVGELKERIQTQIRLERDGQGYSRIEIV